MMRRPAFLVALLFAGSLTMTLDVFADEPSKSSRRQKPGPELTDAELAFQKLLTGAVLVGHFTKSGQQNDKLSEERYEITTINKVSDKNNLWRFFVRIKYGKFDVTLPLDMPVAWAGDTPMISLTDFAVPPLGTFSARVFFHDDRYAGTWQHGQIGGHLFGTIERGKVGATEAAPAATSKSSPAKK